ncbi:uncharacterized protein MYCFIDRAFT_173475 [Pseudocercospora fijiensis CIRAD86]|uniref:Uncharacterized protein n=1 Tax=Pseudocercospora fijiensis (strain CIRAD86) TaxID=383855 RepID=M3AIS3_PSEFD|nr:uncharacterized protein MYCFIDRAFT_173475 [Pseudocercospora fijiensis CIRAD86]EME84496.1 hypothetical protein MYCFIDRAFT_173475 [Pseudocercospora fijiensis CIRAD86]
MQFPQTRRVMRCRGNQGATQTFWRRKKLREWGSAEACGFITATAAPSHVMPLPPDILNITVLSDHMIYIAGTAPPAVTDSVHRPSTALQQNRQRLDPAYYIDHSQGRSDTINVTYAHPMYAALLVALCYVNHRFRSRTLLLPGCPGCAESSVHTPYESLCISSACYTSISCFPACVAATFGILVFLSQPLAVQEAENHSALHAELPFRTGFAHAVQIPRQITTFIATRPVDQFRKMAPMDNAFLDPSREDQNNMMNASWAAHSNNLTTRSRASSVASSRYVPQDYLFGKKTPAELLNPSTHGGALVPVDEISSVRSYEPSVPEQYAVRPHNPQLALQPYPDTPLPLGGYARPAGRPRASTESRHNSARTQRQSEDDAYYHSTSDRDLQRSRSHKERSRHRHYETDRDKHRSGRSRKDSYYDDSHKSSSSRDSSKSKDRKDKEKPVKRASSTTKKRRPTYVNAAHQSRKLQLRSIGRLFIFLVEPYEENFSDSYIRLRYLSQQHSSAAQALLSRQYLNSNDLPSSFMSHEASYMRDDIDMFTTKAFRNHHLEGA